MLRAIWKNKRKEKFIHYQLLEIPLDDLRLIKTAQFLTVGKREGRKSLGADIVLNGQTILRAVFDASDGKCQIKNLSIDRCAVLEEWDQRLPR